MSRYLIVTWDGAGNLVPTLGVVRKLVEAGHEVRVLGHETILERCGDAGARFIPFPSWKGWSEMQDASDTEEEIGLMIDELCFSPSIAKDTASELQRERPDAVLVDSMLFSAISAAQASGVPTATLFHTAYTLFRGGPMVEMFAPGLKKLNAQRAADGLAAFASLPAVHDACDLALVAVPSEFEPEAGDAPNVLRMGPVLDAPALARDRDEVEVPDGATPVVLVSLSTSEQGQADLLQRCADAVASLPVRAVITTGPEIDPATVRAGANTQVVRFVPHTEILPTTSLVITHAGLGTTMAALGSGVPMVCVPMGRDQFFNAERVDALGAGRMLMPDVDAPTIADAAREVMGNASNASAAKQLAATIANYKGAADAVAALERIAVSNP